jgi:hypothetical protein
VVLSMSSMHPRSSGMAVASARRATVTQLTSSPGRCRTRAATAWILNRLATSDLQSSIRGANVTLWINCPFGGSALPRPQLLDGSRNISDSANPFVGDSCGAAAGSICRK